MVKQLRKSHDKKAPNQDCCQSVRVCFKVSLNVLPVLTEDPSRGQVLLLLSKVVLMLLTQTFYIYNLHTKVYIENVTEIIVIRVISLVICFISIYNCKAIICVLGFA